MELAAYVGGFLLLATLAGLLARYFAGKLDMFSYQTFFLLGMVAFFFAPMVAYKLFEYATVYVPDGSGWNILVGGVVLFMGVYLLFSRLGRKSLIMNRILPKFELPVTKFGLLVTGVVSLVASVLIYRLLYTPSELTVVTVFVLGFVPALIAFGIQLITALIVKNPRNVVYWAIGVTALGGGVVLTTALGNDRRYVLGVLLAVPWMLYYAWLRYKTPKFALTVSAVGIFVATSFVLAYTNLRHNITFDERALATRQTQLTEAASNPIWTRENMTALFAQDAAIMSMYYIENYPNNFEFIPFHGAIYTIVNPVPRAIWPSNPFLPEKPVGLGIQMQRALNTGGNLGTGIIGHGWAELGWVGIAYYAAFFGFLIPAIDRVTRLRINNPYYIAAIGANMGNVLALSRGETALFLVLIIYGLLGIWLVVYAMKLPFIKAFLNVGPPAEFGPPEGYVDTVDFDGDQVDYNDMIEAGSYAEYGENSLASSEHGERDEHGELAGVGAGGAPGAVQPSPGGLDGSPGG